MWSIEERLTESNGWRQAATRSFLYCAGALAATEALEVLDVRQDDLFSADPLTGKRMGDAKAGEETQ